MFQRTLSLLLLSGVLTLCGNNSADAQSAANVLLVINETSQASRAIGEYYSRKRNIAPANTCHLTLKAEESVARGDYDRLIQQPIWRCLASSAAQDRILYIVLTKGVPLRINGSGGRDGTTSSVDSELALLYRRQTGIAVPVAGQIANPYFAGNQPVSEAATQFTRERTDIYLVTRLDGFSVQDVIGMIDRGSATVTDGRIVLDGRSSWQAAGNLWLRTAADTLKSMGQGDRVEFDEGAKVVTNERQVLGYYSWGSNDPAIKVRQFNMSFVPGALAAMFVSSDARTFEEPPATWTLGDPQKPETFFGGSPQSLTGDFIRAGVTGTAGHVAEPYLDATIRPDILFPAYLGGANLAEAFYMAMPYLSWQTVVVGDPLCAPFRASSIASAELDRPLDPATELPPFFSARRRKLIEANQFKTDAASAYLRYEARSNRGDADGAREALEQTVAAAPRFAAGQLLLATGYQTAGAIDRAVEHYKAILAYAPNEVVALNNLAFILSTIKHAPADALPLAERACALVNNNPMVLDTLGWIQHLLNRDADAARSFRDAVAGAPNVAEIRWHAAVVFAAAADPARATEELNAALKLDPKLAETEDIRKLRERLAAKTPAR